HDLDRLVLAAALPRPRATHADERPQVVDAHAVEQALDLSLNERADPMLPPSHARCDDELFEEFHGPTIDKAACGLALTSGFQTPLHFTTGAKPRAAGIYALACSHGATASPMPLA